MFECEAEEEYYEKLKGQKWVECPYCRELSKVELKK
jgi:hypothetical protein